MRRALACVTMLQLAPLSALAVHQLRANAGLLEAMLKPATATVSVSKNSDLRIMIAYRL